MDYASDREKRDIIILSRVGNANYSLAREKKATRVFFVKISFRASTPPLSFIHLLVHYRGGD